jgi:hypothetical protein
MACWYSSGFMEFMMSSKRNNFYYWLREREREEWIYPFT